MGCGRGVYVQGFQVVQVEEEEGDVAVLEEVNDQVFVLGAAPRVPDGEANRLVADFDVFFF